MLNSIISKLSEQKWSVITLEASILAANVFFLSQLNTNFYLAISVILILSLFCFFFVSRRFLLFFPSHPVFDIPTPRFDTFLLRSFLILAIAFLVGGIIDLEWGNLPNLKASGAILFYVASFLLFVVPLLWAIFGNGLVQQSIREKIMQSTFEYKRKCPEGYHDRIVTKKLLSGDVVETTFNCEKCDYEFSHSESIFIGY